MWLGVLLLELCLSVSLNFGCTRSLATVAAVAQSQQQQQQQQQKTPAQPPPPFTPLPHAFHAARLAEYRSKVKEIYYTALEDYLEFAYPKDELQPISFSLTLVDALDTAIVLGDLHTFAAMVDLVKFINVDQNVNVSVFETNIRMVGGLLSSHIIALRDPSFSAIYDGILLKKAEEIARKLLPAFDTPTGIPYGTVNLKHGVNKGESSVVCTACAGTFSLEFAWLSLLTGDPVFEIASRKAVRALWNHRSSIDLFGNHIDVITGQWIYPECSIGGGVDSFFEYLFKSYIAFSDETEYGLMFKEVYRAIKIYMRKASQLHVDVHYDSGIMGSPHQWSLGAFWPSIKVLAGDVYEAIEDMAPIAKYLWTREPFLPEIRNLDHSFVQGRAGYPLRPEFIESMLYLYRATKDDAILELAFDLVDRINLLSRSRCGFANIANVQTLEKEDKMESFFLAETLKYLYLLFDPDNEFNVGNYVFNTEAHPFPVFHTYKTDMHPLFDSPAIQPGHVSAPIAEHARKGYHGDRADHGVRGLDPS
eukprot:jgi/Hompol1/3618/HPOL_003305-RA